MVEVGAGRPKTGFRFANRYADGFACAEIKYGHERDVSYTTLRYGDNNLAKDVQIGMGLLGDVPFAGCLRPEYSSLATGVA